MRPEFIPATTADANDLSDLAFVSKQHWNYPPEWMEFWKDELHLTEKYISENLVFKVKVQNELVGFFALLPTKDRTIEIDHLWIVPNKINKGLGRSVFSEIRELAASKNVSKLILVAEPFAKGFYLKMGGRPVSKFQSKINGRYLERFEFDV